MLDVWVSEKPAQNLLLTTVELETTTLGNQFLGTLTRGGRGPARTAPAPRLTTCSAVSFFSNLPKEGGRWDSFTRCSGIARVRRRLLWNTGQRRAALTRDQERADA